MCGIAGILGQAPPERVLAMVKAMHHRGPDDSGVHHEAGIALGMARLAIIDTTTGGHQPMRARDGLIWIVYNGELYNFHEERAILEKKGHSFQSRSDTEVVLRMYEEYGDAFLLRLRGMFALAIYDKRKGPGKEKFLLARDHLGIKPLLYSQSAGNLLFASEIKALLASGMVAPHVNPEALRLLLTFGSVAQPQTMIKGVHMLLPGHRLTIEGGKQRIEQFWRLDTGRRGDLKGLPYEELVAITRDSLEESVRLQMVSDVPVGAFLSGGIDSSLLVALMARNSSHRVRTFSVGFEAEGASMDESNDAARTAAYIGTDHARVVVTGQEVRSRIHHIAAALDQPSVDGVNSYFVSLAARQAVTVAISGTGGDELFAGYPWFITMTNYGEQEAALGAASLPAKLLAAAARNPLWDKLNGTRFGPRLEALRNSHGFLARFARIYQIFGNAGAERFLAQAYKKQASVGRDPSLDILQADEMPGATTLERVSALCMRGYTQNQLLRDIDAVSMSHSLEVRVPFLDPLLADLAMALPRSAKLGRLTGVSNPETASYRDTGTKRVLIDAAQGLLPPGMDQQAKRGFGMPFGTWLKGPLKDVFDDALSPASIAKRGFFDPEAVATLKTSFSAGAASWPQPWLLMMTELWAREVLDTAAPPVA